MRSIDMIVIHCSATRANRTFTEQDVETAHKLRGFRCAGYHFYIRKDGSIRTMRPIEMTGAHAKGFNLHSIGVCYEGGLNELGNPADTRTPWQKHSLRVLVRALLMDYPHCRIVGHRDLSADLNGDGTIQPSERIKECPCFEVKDEVF